MTANPFGGTARTPSASITLDRRCVPTSRRTTDSRTWTSDREPCHLQRIPIRPGSWANRAPEATRDALGSVYRLLHSDLGDDWYQSDEGDFWVLAQQMTGPPVIIAVTAPITALRAWPHEHTAADLLEGLIRAGQSDQFPELFLMDPEWRAEPSQLKLAETFQEVPTRLDRHLAMFMSGEDPATFNDSVREGHWGEPGGYDRAGMPWWSFGEIWRRLTPMRRAELVPSPHGERK